eukprot:TRINITY_DN2301_c0_g1_i4.p1 TRINITY_DN2301_c0_g1~~TRINITY_DN2301_c0_g1_i4.p1  ORF type:complete len:156 (-),score=20.62 TRINITY_DN2301_c0_g1_i4:25-492(-)
MIRTASEAQRQADGERGSFLDACGSGDLNAVQRKLALYPELARVKDPARFNVTGLHHAAMKGQPAVATVLINSRADVDVTKEFGDTPLHLAALANQPEVIRVLLDASADREIKNTNGYTPLDTAMSCKHLEAVEALCSQSEPDIDTIVKFPPYSY